MNRRGEYDVIVVGAGVVGAAMALALVRDGFDVALVEAKPAAPWTAEDEIDPRVVALAPDAVALFQDLGVWPSVVQARACAYSQMRVWDAIAPGELAFNARDRGEAALGWIVENRLLQHVLWQALVRASDSGASPHLRVPGEVTGIENDDARVVASLADGTQLRACVLVAADGANSPIRKMLGITTREHDYGQRAVVAHVATERSHEDTAWQRFQPGGPLAFLPLSDGRCSIVWSLPESEANRVLALDDAAFCNELGCAIDFRLGRITTSTRRLAFPLRMRLAERYVAGRTLLMGDAGHAVHPLAGQGLNLGLRDVANLRRQLLKARSNGKDFGVSHVLRRYERERRSENALAANSFTLIERSFNSEAVALAGLRGLALQVANRVSPIKRLLGDAAAGRI